MTTPTILGISSFAAGSGVGSGLTRAWPAGHGINDVAIAIAESAAEAVVAPTNFLEDTNSPQSTGTAGDAAAVRATFWYLRANSGSMPDVQIANPGNHVAWFVVFLRDVFTTGNPIVASAGNTAASASGFTIPGLTTPNADCIILAGLAHSIKSGSPQITAGSWTNASLANLTERMNQSTASGGGGGLGLVTGDKATAGVVSATTGSLASASTQARFCLAVRGLASGGTAPADSDFLCGGECAAPPGLSGAGTRHFDSETGTPFVSQTTIARNSGRAWRSSPIGALSFRSRGISGTTRWLRWYVRFPTLPLVDTVIARFRTAAGSSCELRYRAATHDIVGAVGTAITTPHPVSAGNWYRVELAGDVGTGTRTMKLTAGPAGGTMVDRGTASAAVTAGSFVFLDVGASIVNNITADLVWDDLRSGANVALYPVGEGQIIGVQLASDGTHSFTPAGDFKYDNSSNVATNATDTWSRLVGLLDNFIQFLAASAVTAGEYLEWLFGGMPATTSVAALELISTHEGSDTNAHKQTLRLVDGGTTVDVFTDTNFGQTGLMIHSKHYKPSPAGTAWTTAKINALKLRWGSSWTTVDLTGVPFIGGVMAEVDCVLSVPPPPPPDPSPQNPVHVYPGAGTYPVTLKVTDDQGLTDEVTHSVTVS